MTGKTKVLRIILNSLAKKENKLLCFVWVSYYKTLSNETKAKVDILQNARLCCSYVVILDEINAIMCQINIMDTFANESTLNFLKQYQRSEVMHKGLKLLQKDKHVTFSVITCKKVRAIAVQASKLLKLNSLRILSRVYFGQIDRKQYQEDFADINAT
ncbi:hypothetical protein Glove_541g86 [Diversispora epigaea]|uniref:Uncharacterized protein n=1 Tax=Diversispora epigaea TaxID=1348612 RepID=A0A397GIG8_9GLOM|nr:hypothetical protein Glove_541g86 [Diversispora epigaea]